MNTKKKRNRIILSIFSVFILVFSIFSLFSFSNDTKFVKADSWDINYSYSGSNIASNTTFTRGNFTYNLFDKNAVELNKAIYGSGNPPSIVSSSGWYVSDYIYIGNLSNFYINDSKTSGGSNIFYDSNMNFLSILNYTINGLFSVPTNASYVRINGLISELDVTQVTAGSSQLPYVPYSNTTSVNYKFDFSSQFDPTDLLSSLTTTFDFSNDMKFTRVSNSDYNYIYGNTYNTSNYSLENGGVMGSISTLTFSSYTTDNSNNITLNNDYMFRIYFFYDYIDNSSYNRLSVFQSDIQSVVLGSYLDSNSYFVNDYSFDSIVHNSKYNFISYLDSNNNSINFLIPLDSQVDSDYWQFRVYDVGSKGDSSYLLGYNDGLKNTEQYTQGYIAGEDSGYWDGYEQALENEDRYNFTNLIASVIDVPVRTFTSLFNFEILGVNLSGFFLGLLTCCIVIGVVRLIL